MADGSRPIFRQVSSKTWQHSGFTYGEVVFSLPHGGELHLLLGEFDSLGQVGCRVEAQFGRRKLQGLIVLSFIPRSPRGILRSKRFSGSSTSSPSSGPITLPLAKKVAAYTLSSLGEVLFSMIPGGKREKAVPLLGESTELGAEEAKVLSEEQRAAIRRHQRRGHRGASTTWRGSPAPARRKCSSSWRSRPWARGEGVIYLVPEISLTHQIKRTLAQRFPSGGGHPPLQSDPLPAIWSNGARSSGGRLTWWWVRGAPSLPHLSEARVSSSSTRNTRGPTRPPTAPRYHARQVAQFLGGLSGAKVLMGSATPSLEASFFMDQGRIPRYKP
jgi:primosomal protein N' (replication factor Y)